MATPLESINEKQYMDMVQLPFKILEEIYLKDDDNRKKAKLMNQLRDHIKVGGKVSYNTIPQQYVYAVTTALEDQNIPYITVPDAKGNMLAVVREEDSEKLLEIQKTFMLTSTDYAKELTTQNVLDLYKVHGYKEVDTLSFANKEMAMVAEKKLYGAGITFAKTEDKDGVTKLILSPFSKFSVDGNDLCNFELLHAFEQSKAGNMFKEKGVDLLGLRFEQAKWDQDQMNEFVSHVKAGDSYVFAPGHGKVNAYIESTNMGVALMERDNKIEGGWRRTSISISPDASEREIEIALSKAASKINDAIPMPVSNFDREVQLSKKDITDKDKLRPDGGEGLIKRIELASNQDLKPMLAAINAEATKKMNNLVGTEYMSQQAAYKKKKEIISDIIAKRELSEIQDFLNSNANSLSQADRKEWLNNIEKHFVNTQEKDNPYECVMGRESRSSLSNELSKTLTKVLSPDKSQEAEQDLDE